MSEAERGISLERADQIGVVVKNIDEVVEYYKNILGFGDFEQPEINYSTIKYYGKEVDCDWKMAFCDLGGVELELIEPIQGPTIYHDFMEKQKEGLHHIGFIVNNYDEITSHIRETNIEIMQSGEGKTSRFAYFDTQNPGGVIYEIIERKVERV